MISLTQLRRWFSRAAVNPKADPVFAIACKQGAMSYHEQHMIRMLQELDIRMEAKVLTREDYQREMLNIIRHGAIALCLSENACWVGDEAASS